MAHWTVTLDGERALVVAGHRAYAAAMTENDPPHLNRWLGATTPSS